MRWTLRPARPADLEDLVEIRAVVMRPDLERLGRYDAHRVRQRLRDSFSPDHTRIIEVGGELVGSIAVRPAEDRRWLEHFYLAPHHQGQGLGSAVLRSVLEQAETDVWLNVLQGSPARKLYERHGFVVDSQDPVDVFMVRKFL
ncbi:GNAT family N-acetyltransferase [Kribbella sp. NBC_00709]|uniref:GNAT family N-acetyltransferase n=1 Tax=Kribbella sp. NBC_00709 TaxID=2975972 RepID=UPI002E2DAAF0|nr:GNAT family N-acetyltransferase [Kribbella sp. NBC_00709]